VRAFYKANPELFREPERLRASVILVKVDPSAAGAQWQQTLEQVQALRQRIVDGDASFEEVAREYSDDPSASQGGDMGYMHEGMLGETAEDALAELQPGEVSEPLVLLEGVTLMRLDERRDPRQREFAAVAERARDLLTEHRAERRWEEFLAGLHERASIEVDETYLQPGGPDASPAGRD